MGEFSGPPPCSQPEAVPLRATMVRWRIVALLLAFSFMSWFNRVSMSVAYDEQIQHEFGISEEDIGTVYSALLFAYMICMTPGGWLADKYGPWRALAFMSLGSALFAVLTGVIGLGTLSAAALLVWLLVIRSAMGVCMAPIYPASARAVAHWMPFRQRAGTNGMITAAALIGIASTYMGFGTLLDLFHWPAAFVITGTLTALLAGLWMWYGRDLPAQHRGVNEAEVRLIQAGDLSVGPAPAAGAWRALFRNRSVLCLALSYAAIGYFQYLFFFWIRFYFKDVLKVGMSESRLYATYLNLAMAAGMVLGGWLADRLVHRWGRRRGRAAVAAGGMLLGAALLGAGLLAQEPLGIGICFALAMAAIGATEGPFWATAIELGGRHGATAGGIVNTGGNAGGVLAPFLTPRISKAFGWGWGIGLGSLVCLAGVCLWLWIDPEQRPHAKPIASDQQV